MVATDRGKWLDVATVARMYGFPVRHLYHLIEDGSIEALNLARDPAKRPRWKVSIDSLEAFIAGRRTLKK